MKRNSHFLMLLLTIFTVILSACGGTTIPVTGSGSAVQTLPTAFIAVVENITGDQWTISGQTVTIDPGVVSGGPFNTGDLVKVEVIVNQDGAFTVSSVETPSVKDLSTLPRLGDGTDNANDANSNENTNVNSNDNTNNANSNDNDVSNVNSNNNTNANNNSNDANTNDDNGNNSNSNDDNNDNGNGNDDNDNGNDNDSSGPGSGGNDNDDSGGNDNDSNDNG